MKKLFSIITLLVLVVTLTACDSADLEKQIEDLQQEVADLNDQIATKNTMISDQSTSNTELENELDQLELEIDDLVQEIEDLQDLIYDNVITFTFKNEYGDYSSGTVGFDDDFTGNLFHLLDENFDVTYLDTDYGKMITGLENINTMTGNYIAFTKNDEMSMVGVETATFEDGDVFGFEISWYDNTEKAVFDAINLFLENQVDDYTTSTKMDYNVIAALSLLDLLDEHVVNTDVVTYLDAQTPSSVTDYFKMIVIAEATDAKDVSALYTSLNAMTLTGGYGQTAYGLLAMNAGNTTEDYSSHVTAGMTDLTTSGNTPFDLGLDSGGISIVMLSEYVSETGVQAEIDAFTNWIKTDQLPSGGIKTRDTVWGDTTYPGTENAASMAQVILALVACGIDPTSADYTEGTNDLVLRLTEFQTTTGSFDWDITADPAEDLLFSTPQAFLALVAYQTFSNTYAAVNPYDFTVQASE